MLRFWGNDMKRLILGLILTAFCSKLSFSNTIIHCKDFKGSTIYKDDKGNSINKSDGYSQQDLKITISDMNSKTQQVKWLNEQTPVELVANSEKDGWMAFHQTYFANVYRVFTYFGKTKEMAIVEIQTHLYNEVGNVKSLLGYCNLYEE